MFAKNRLAPVSKYLFTISYKDTSSRRMGAVLLSLLLPSFKISILHLRYKFKPFLTLKSLNLTSSR